MQTAYSRDQCGGLIAYAAKTIGIPTMTIGSMKAPLRRVKPPRSMVTPVPRGTTLGVPGDQAQQCQVLLAACTAVQPMTESAWNKGVKGGHR